MVTDKLHEKLNEQMNYEFYSASAYVAMAAYCSAESLDGFANFFLVQAEEERFHALKFYHYLNSVGKRATVLRSQEPNNHFTSVLACFELALQQEKEVTKRIYELMDIAQNEREHATVQFLQWFIAEQVEEEDMFDRIINKLKRIEKDSSAFYLLDEEFAQRSFTPPPA